MVLSLQELQLLIKESLQENQWNKDSNTPRDYSKEYNAPGSKEQDERNKRKRDKRKHDKEEGECPEGEELHHVNGIEEDELKCEPVSKNRGRKGEGARFAKDVVIKITKKSLDEIIEEESKVALHEFFGALAGAALSSAAKGAASAVGEKAIDAVFGDDEDDEVEKETEKDKDKMTKGKLGNLQIKSFDDLKRSLDAVFGQAIEKPLQGDSKELEQALIDAPELMKQLKK